MYNWKFTNVGGNSRVSISTVEDVKHLGELDQKMWTVLSCPTTGLEIPDDVLAMIDTDGDGKIRVNEVVAMANHLLATAKDPEVLVSVSKAEALAAELAEIDAKIAATTAEQKAAPAAPYDADVIAAWHAAKDANDAYFKALALEKLGLVKVDPETAPAIAEKDWAEMSAKISAYEAEAAAVASANAAAMDAATADLKAERKEILLQRWFAVLLRNYVTLTDFYAKDGLAAFQCGRLIIDQRECRLCVRVNDAGTMAAEAGKSGMYLLFCDCVSKSTGKTLHIVAAVTVGDVDDLFVGKNGIFYDRNGVDYDAKVTKIIDNPISIKQAFWSPYKKFGNWVKDLINKSAAEKESKSFDNMKAKATETTAATADAAADKSKAQAFDIAKFAGIFAAIGMAVGYIGAFFVSLGNGIASLTWWQLILVIIGLMLCISGPSMFLAWLKLRSRNLAPVLNANGWAINAKSVVSVPFGVTLTDEAKFPLLAGQKKGKGWRIFGWIVAVLLILAGIAFGLHKAGLCPCCCHEDECQTECCAEPVEEAVCETPAEEAVEAVVEE